MPLKPKFPGLDQFHSWATESPSVLDSPGEEIARKGARLLGLDDPNAPITEMMSPMSTGPMSIPLAGLISIFKDKAARMVGTQAFRDKLAALGNGTLAAAGDEFAARFPRVAAHMSPSQGPSTGTGASGYLDHPGGRVREPMPMKVTPEGVKSSTGNYEEAQQLFFHEGAHAAQALGNRHSGELYAAADDAAGYTGNPFERSATRVELRKTIDPSLAPISALRELRKIAQSQPSGTLGNVLDSFKVRAMPRSESGVDPRKTIGSLLDYRTRPKP